MIKATNVTKMFDNYKALDNMSCEIKKGCVYGLVGSNGAGKSTFLRLVTGIYKADAGDITINGISVFENPEAKKNFVFVPDELFFTPQATMNKMSKLYAASYEKFDFKRFNELTNAFRLNPKANINTFSKGMKRQAATILALSCSTDYIFLDETFDGLDPVMRNLVKKVIYNDVYERQLTAVITSHSLRELEDTCDQLSLLHKGGIIFESDIQNLQTSLFKVQIAFTEQYDKSKFDGIEILHWSKNGSVANIIIKGDKAEVARKLKSMQPTIFEILPLSLEEVFVFEMEAKGYSFDDVFLKEEI